MLTARRARLGIREKNNAGFALFDELSQAGLLLIICLDLVAKGRQVDGIAYFHWTGGSHCFAFRF